MSLACSEHKKIGFCGWCDACQAIAAEPADPDVARLRKRRHLIAKRAAVMRARDHSAGSEVSFSSSPLAAGGTSPEAP